MLTLTPRFMQEGLDRDDIYIMVEDEFQAVAKTFTQHLHHAEYMRLKKLVRTQNASTISTISRPVDSITKMREETKKKKEAEAKSAKQQTALQQIMGRARGRRPQTDSENSESDEEKHDDPWVGTTLQGLMTKSPHKPHTSLTGLQGVKSSTRAAAGYSKPESRPLQRPKLFDLSPTAGQRKRPNPPPQPANDEEDATSSGDDDDLDAPISKPPLKSGNHNVLPPRKAAREIRKRATALSPSPPPLEPVRYSAAKTTASIPPRTQTSSRPSQPTTAAPPPSSASTLRKPGILKSKLSTFDDPFASFVRPSAAERDGEEVSRRLAKRRADLRAKARADEERDRKRKGGGGVDEIPVFLV